MGPWLFRGREVQHAVKSQFHRDFTAEDILPLQINTQELNPCIKHNAHLKNDSPKLEGGSVHPSWSETTVRNVAQQDSPHFNNVIAFFLDPSQLVYIWNWHILLCLSGIIKTIKSSPDIFSSPAISAAASLTFSCLYAVHISKEKNLKNFFLLSIVYYCLKYWKSILGGKMTIKSDTSSATPKFYFVSKRTKRRF